jgi:lysine 6-dehydrogenase
MKIAVVGSGLMGSSAARYLAARREVKAICLLDKDKSRLDYAVKSVRSRKLLPRLIDAADARSITESIKGFDAVLMALPHAAAYSADLAAIDAGVDAVDLVYEDVLMKLHSKCLKSGVTLIPGCGVAPGIAQILAGEGARQLTSVDEIHMLVGGLPQIPRPPLNYRIVFSFESVLKMYTKERARVIRDGKIKTMRQMTEIEKVSFPKPYENMEAFLTDGVATLLFTMKGRAKTIDEKTIRYPGHAEQIKTLIATGLTSTKPVRVNGVRIVPRTVLSDILGPKLRLGREKDVTLLRVIVTGAKDQTKVRQDYEMVDYYDERENVTSMARTTAFTGAIAAMMVAEGRIDRTGIVPPETCFLGRNFNTLFGRLAEKNVRISKTMTSKVRDFSGKQTK